MTPKMWVNTGFYPSLDRAQTALRNLRIKRRVRENGFARLKDEGHPELVYTKGWVVRSGQQKHDLMNTYVRYAINATESWRHDLHKDIRMDLVIRIMNERHKGLMCAVEIDMDQTSYDRIVEERYKPYVEHKWQGPVLWVVHADTPAIALTRMNGLRTRAESIKSIAFFTTSYLLLETPEADVFVDFGGKPWGLGNGNGPLIGQKIGELTLKGIGKPWE